jgi:ATP-dependent Lhr-like helicase
MNAYERLAPFIQDYIFKNRWESLRDVQEAACDVIFNTDENLLLSTGTASGNTEAAFLPTLTLISENPPDSVGILYVSPLKALINDQFTRLDNLLKEGRISVCKWHGDAPTSAKAKLLASPQGVMQTTPESLESLLMRKRGDCQRLFKDLRFVVVDEVHHFMESPRGVQLLCILERIQKLAKCRPRRIGLSATLSDTSSAERWLCSGSKRGCATPRASGGARVVALRMRRFVTGEASQALGPDSPADGGEDDFHQAPMDHFYSYDDEDEDFEDDYENKDYKAAPADEDDPGEIEHYKYLYRQTLGKKAIVFTRSRAESERIISSVRQISAAEKTKDYYYTHHSSISASLREEAESAMKHGEGPTVIGATLTLELGIDLGALDRVIQVGSPVSVSSFTQRVGRCGRKEIGRAHV